MARQALERAEELKGIKHEPKLQHVLESDENTAVPIPSAPPQGAPKPRTTTTTGMVQQ